MARILAISSQVVFGPVGLSAIVPALQAEGHEVLALPTILLSNHPGHGRPAGVAQELPPIIDALEKLGAFKNIDAVLTGYFANAAQVETVAALLKRLQCPIVLVDPVIGDHGKLYVPQDVAGAIRDLLLPLASILMPNVFELAWLSVQAVNDPEAALRVARSLKIENVIVTSVPLDDDRIGTLSVTATNFDQVSSPHLKSVPHGTGDYLSGLFLARQFSDMKLTALADSHAILQRAIALSGGTGVLAVAEGLHQTP
jgi:pyridoxine kinase